jgi:hypothetical protein
MEMASVFLHGIFPILSRTSSIKVPMVFLNRPEEVINSGMANFNYLTEDASLTNLLYSLY